MKSIRTTYFLHLLLHYKTCQYIDQGVHRRLNVLIGLMSGLLGVVLTVIYFLGRVGIFALMILFFVAVVIWLAGVAVLVRDTEGIVDGSSLTSIPLSISTSSCEHRTRGTPDHSQAARRSPRPRRTDSDVVPTDPRPA